MKNRKVARFEVRVLQRAEVEVEQDSSYKLDVKVKTITLRIKEPML